MNDTFQTETIEAAETAAVTTDAELADFDAGWDEELSPVSVTEAEVDEVYTDKPEADQPEADAAVDENKTADGAAATDETPAAAEAVEDSKADQLFTLKHLDETREVNRDEVITLAQKGMDYDRKVGKLNNELAEYKEFFEELAANSGLSREQFMDSVRAKMMVAAEKAAGREISESEAIFRVQRGRADKVKAAEEAAKQEAQKAQEAQRQKAAAEVKAFTDRYPGVKLDSIPRSVWDDVNGGSDLLGAYTRYLSAETAKENAQLKKQLEAFENNVKNASRSTGSRKTAGAPKVKDDFDAGWESV